MGNVHAYSAPSPPPPQPPTSMSFPKPQTDSEPSTPSTESGIENPGPLEEIHSKCKSTNRKHNLKFWIFIKTLIFRYFPGVFRGGENYVNPWTKQSLPNLPHDQYELGHAERVPFWGHLRRHEAIEPQWGVSDLSGRHRPIGQPEFNHNTPNTAESAGEIRRSSAKLQIRSRAANDALQGSGLHRQLYCREPRHHFRVWSGCVTLSASGHVEISVRIRIGVPKGAASARWRDCAPQRCCKVKNNRI